MTAAPEAPRIEDTSPELVLQNWFSDCPGVIELRLLPSKAQHYHDTTDSLIKASGKCNGEAVYFGVATRDGKGGGKANIVSIPGVWVDLDFKETPREEAKKLLREFPLKPTFITASGGGWHYYWKFKEPAGKDDILRVEAILRGIAKALKGDMAATDASRILRVPGTLNRKYDPPAIVRVVKSYLDRTYNLSDFDLYVDASPVAKAAPPVGDSIPATKRNHTLASLAGSMRRRGMSQQSIETALLSENVVKCFPPLSESEVRGIAASIARYEPTVTPAVEAPPAVEVSEIFRPTDLWNARFFAHLNKDNVRYCERRGGWHVYDGKRWVRSMCGEVERLAKDTAREILEMGKQEGDDRLREHMVKHSLRTEAADKITAMLKLASTEDGIVVPPDAFDANPWLFNVANGTLNLRTGELLPHRHEDLLTNLSPAEWRGIDARGERFEMFLCEAMDYDQEKYDYLERATGYSIAGDMREQVFFFLYGPEAAGKGTFVRAIAGVMGSYSTSAQITTFLKIRNRSQVRNDLASLIGSRLVTASEPEDGESFDEGVMKVMTGEDQTKARFLYKEEFDFTATFKLWFQGNHRPHIKSTGKEMYRRLRIVPFTKTVPEERRDNTLGATLTSPEERAGILAWMVRGCLEWQKGGLRTPKVIQDAVEDYRTSEDRFGPYLEERTGRSAAGMVTKGDLYVDYKTWCEKNGERPITKRAVGTQMEQLGFSPDDRISGGIRVWKGIFLVNRGGG